MEKILQYAMRRLRLARATRAAARVALWAVPGSLAAFAALRLWPVIEHPWLVLMAGACATLLAFAWVFVSTRPSELSAAVKIDSAMGLNEALSTAVALRGAPMAPALQLQARTSIAGVQAGALRRHLPIHGLISLGWASLALLLGALLTLQLPHLTPPAGAQDIQSAGEKAKEAQQVREAARRTDAELAQIEQLAELRKMEALRRAAVEARQKMAEIQQKPTSARDAMAEFSRLADKVRNQRDEQLGKDSEMKFGEDSSDPLSELAAELDRLDPTGLQADLEDFKQRLEREAAEARKEGREPVVVRRQLQELLKRAKDTKRALEKLERQLKDNPKLEKQLRELTEKQRDLLKKISQQLERLQKR